MRFWFKQFMLLLVMVVVLAGCTGQRQAGLQKEVKTDGLMGKKVQAQEEVQQEVQEEAQAEGKLEEKSGGQSEAQTASKSLKVHFIDVGQGDSIFIQSPNGKTMLIDAGPRAAEDKVVSYLKSQGVSHLDIVVGTHPHEDHIGKMAEAIDTFGIGSIYMPKVSANTKVFREVLGAIKNKGLKVKTAMAGVPLDWDEEVSAEILAPHNSKYEDINNDSAVIKLTFGNTRFLFMGDAEALSEGEMLSGGADLKADVLKVGHHGSYSSSTPAFLKEVAPQYAMISCGEGNDYGHPHQQTLKKLSKAKIQVFRTDLCGTVVASSDGENIEMKQEK